MDCIRYLFPGAKPKSFTLSYDDGRDFDRKLVGIMNEHGIRGTFHLNSGNLDKEGRVTKAELAALYKGHEISCHTCTHPFLERIPQPEQIREILEDRRTLESAAGYPVRGMSYPFGTWNADVLKSAEACGIVYSRTTAATGDFRLPDNFLLWHPTGHHSHDILAKAEQYKTHRWGQFTCFYVWGHSYEFNNNNNWELIENLCKSMEGLSDVWYATNIEIYDYVTAARSLAVSVDGHLVFNPSAQTVFFSKGEKVYSVKPGETLGID